jgi:hypothetical protein
MDIKPNFQIIQVGKPYVDGITAWPNRMEYNYRAGQHELRLTLSNLKYLEIAAVRRGRCEFAFMVHRGLIFFLYRFEAPSMPIEAIPWSDNSYSWWRVPEEDRTIPSAVGPNDHLFINMMLINADNGIVEGLRTATFSPEFGRKLHDAIRDQASRPYDPLAENRAVLEAYQLYPRSDLMAANAEARCFAGD